MFLLLFALADIEWPPPPNPESARYADLVVVATLSEHRPREVEVRWGGGDGPGKFYDYGVLSVDHVLKGRPHQTITVLFPARSLPEDVVQREPIEASVGTRAIWCLYKTSEPTSLAYYLWGNTSLIPMEQLREVLVVTSADSTIDEVTVESIQNASLTPRAAVERNLKWSFAGRGFEIRAPIRPRVLYRLKKEDLNEFVVTGSVDSAASMISYHFPLYKDGVLIGECRALKRKNYSAWHSSGYGEGQLIKEEAVLQELFGDCEVHVVRAPFAKYYVIVGEDGPEFVYFPDDGFVRYVPRDTLEAARDDEHAYDYAKMQPVLLMSAKEYIKRRL